MTADIGRKWSRLSAEDRHLPYRTGSAAHERLHLRADLPAPPALVGYGGRLADGTHPVCNRSCGI